MRAIMILLTVSISFFGCKEKTEKNIETSESLDAATEPLQPPSVDESAVDNGFIINPISHATMVLDWDGTIIYVDPVGGGQVFTGYTKPDIILVTDIHQDHLDAETIKAVIQDATHLIVPKAVADKLPQELKSKATILNNGETKTFMGISMEGIPMYNLRKEALKFHEKGRGNGYVLGKKGKRIYISGDTEDIPEMRNLKNIDIAFVCMNLPYTMTVESAADAVLAFKPKTVYPYHYRGTDGLSDVEKFKTLVENGDSTIKVTQLDWYPKID